MLVYDAQPEPPPPRPMTRQCAWCHAIHSDGEWWNLGLTKNVHRILIGDTIHNVSHGICPACKAGLDVRPAWGEA